MVLKISGNIYPTMVVQIQENQKFMCNTLRDIIRYFFVEGPVGSRNKINI